LTATKRPVIVAVSIPSTFSSPETFTLSPSTFVARALSCHFLSMGEGRRNLTVYSEVTVPGGDGRFLDLISAYVAAQFPWQSMRTEMIPPLPNFPKAT